VRSEPYNIKTARLLLVLLCALTASIGNAYEYSVTPFTGFRVSDSLEEEITEETVDVDETSSFGLILSIRRDRASSYDLYFSRQDTEVSLRSGAASNDPFGIRIDYFHLGGTVEYEEEMLHPFATGGLGIARISPANEVFGTETKFSFSLGGGVMAPISENVRVRIEARALGITISGDRRILCANGQCEAQFEGSLFMQYEANIGLSVAF
jgi:opacity protein-like surface antigen